jgi:polyisoprenoid-binding protein YceI
MQHTLKRSRWHLALLLVVALLAGPVKNAAASAKANWSADPAHSEISFSVNHFFTPVNGSFNDYNINLDYDPEHPEKSSVEARIKVASVNTGNEKRDSHLRSGDWFDADENPYITFKSKSVRKVDENQLIASGQLTIRGKSRQIDLPITLLGTQMIPEPMQKMLGGAKNVASFQATLPIDRGDFGVGVGDWAATMVVGRQVDINILVEARNI